MSTALTAITSCEQLLDITVLTAITSCGQHWQLIQAVISFACCRQLWQSLKAVISFDSCYKLSTSFTAGKSCDIFDNCYNVLTALTAVTAVTAKNWQPLQIVDGFDSCNKLSTALTTVTSYWQLLQPTSVNSIDSCYKLPTASTAVTSCWQFLQAIGSYDSWSKLDLNFTSSSTYPSAFDKYPIQPQGHELVTDMGRLSWLPNSMILAIHIWITVLIIFHHPSNREI